MQALEPLPLGGLGKEQVDFRAESRKGRRGARAGEARRAVQNFSQMGRRAE